MFWDIPAWDLCFSHPAFVVQKLSLDLYAIFGKLSMQTLFSKW